MSGFGFNPWGIGRGTSMLIEHNDSVSASNPQVAVTISGNGIAVWRQSNGSIFSEDTRLSIGSNRYVVGTGWGNEELIASDETQGFDMYPQVAVDAYGNAIAVWSQFNYNHYDVWSNRYIESESDVGPSLLASITIVLVIIAIVISTIIFCFFFFRKKRRDMSRGIINEEKPPLHG